MDEERYDRQIALFGKTGQKAISKTRVTIVGCGGLGSHMAQQLTYLGVKRVALIDSDRAELSNLNRLIGAVPEDADQHRLKVEVVGRMIRAIAPDVEAEELPRSVIGQEGFETVKASSVVFGCVDTDAVRLILTHLCLAHCIPYFDLASEVVNREFGGRVSVSVDGKSCLYCQQELDQREIRRGLAAPEEQALDDELYGIDREILGNSGPSVVSINGVVASLAVTEFMVWKTGMRDPKPLLRYYGAKSQVRQNIGPFQADCPYCKGIYGQEEKGGYDQFLKAD